VVDIRQQVQNRARQLIEEVMIATNGCTARFLAAQGAPRCAAWCARPSAGCASWKCRQGRYGEVLPDEPDSQARWRQFLAAERRRDPLRFPDLSLVIVKLMGRGEYVVERPAGRPSATSAWRCATTRTPPRPTGATPT
jgi:exoribonuclease-2